MFATLPDFTPRDSHSLWYTSSRAPILGGLPDGPHSGDSLHNHHQQHPNAPHHNHHHHQQRQQQRGHILQRTALARLAADEAHLQRRRIHVQNFGSTWLKPPGLPKTLHQMREEKREQEEHHEAMRREQLAQELAEAEAEAAAAAAAGEEEDAMDDVQLDGAQDLDDEIPDADDEFALGGGSSSDEEEEEEEVEEEVDVSAAEEALREERRNDLMTARMRMTDDAFREALVRGDPDADDMYGDAAEEEHDRGHLLDEEDFAGTSLLEHADDDDDDDLGMDANLDDDIPEAEQSYDAGYEHTDSDAALSSERSEDEDEDEDEEEVGFAPRTATPLRPPQSPTSARAHRAARRSTPGPRSSMDLSAFLSQDESSFMDSSPAQTRRNMRG